MNREEAWSILNEFTSNPNLVKHGLAVEAAMRHYADIYSEDQEKWAITGLLHDFDWEIHPTLPDHPLKGAGILRERGVPEEIVRAILSHADFSGVPRSSLMEKALYAVDELTGLVTAVALVRPTKKIHDVDVAAVKKKMKEKSFAAAVNRDDIRKGAEDLGVELDEHIGAVIEALQKISGELGL